MTKLNAAQTEALVKINAGAQGTTWVADIDNRSGEALVRRGLAKRRNLQFSHYPRWVYSVTVEGRLALRKAAN
jgi:hypothetical protein